MVPPPIGSTSSGSSLQWMQFVSYLILEILKNLALDGYSRFLIKFI